MLKGPLACLILCAMGLAPAPATAADCPNESIRESQSSEALPLGTTTYPACMALEMVTPAKKFSQETFTLSAFSADGNRALFTSKAALGDTGNLLYYGGDPYIGIRDTAGWSTAPTSPPASAGISAGTTNQGGPYAFDPDLSVWALFGASLEQEGSGKGQVFRGGLGGAFEPLSPVLTVIDDSGEKEILLRDAFFLPVATSADLSATVLKQRFPAAAYLAEDPRDLEGGANYYVAFRDALGEPTVQLLARDEEGKVWGGRCGVAPGGELKPLTQGAISADGDRIFFSTRPAQEFDPAHPTEPPTSPDCDSSNPLRIMVRTEEGPEIEELLPGGSSEPGDDLFQAASLDGSKVFLATPRNLAAADEDTSAEECGPDVGASKGCDLYLYDADLPEGERLIQVSAGEDVPGWHEEGKGADVLTSTPAISADGSHVYYVAQGVITADENPEGQSAVADEPNLYLYERDTAHPDGQTTFIATLAEGDKGKVWGSEKTLAEEAPYPVPLLGDTPEEGGNGHMLFFISAAPLANDDSDDAADVYRYDATGVGALLCVSCVPGDLAAADAVAGSSQTNPVSNFAQFGRWASEDGQTVAFATAAPLVPEDEDEAVTSYVWKEGRLAILPGEIEGDPSYYKRPTVSQGGNEVGFTTTEALLPTDIDSAKDAYVLRVDGGFPNPPLPSTPCNPLSEGACRGSGSAAVGVQGPATNSFSGPGNQKKPAKCRKGQIRKRGNCVKRKRGKGRKNHKRASSKRGGGR